MTDGGDWFQVDDSELGRDLAYPGDDRARPRAAEDRSADDGASAPAGEAAAGGSAAAGSVVRHLTLAVTFLTGIPLKVEGEVDSRDLWRSMGWYPLVGLVLGAAAWGVYAGLLELLPELVAATLVVLLLEAVTRGLHMDGLMDTADGIFSGAPRERALEIMKTTTSARWGLWLRCCC
jgi:hypothetical protein